MNLATAHDVWAGVADHGLDVVQLVALAWLANRGVVLPPVNRRTRNSRPRPEPRAAEDESQEG